MVFRDSLVTKTKTETTTNMTQKSQGEGFFRVRLVTNTKTETISMTKMKTNMRHLREPFKNVLADFAR